MSGWNVDAGWGSSSSNSSPSDSGWGQETSGWGDSIEEPTSSENNKTLKDIGGKDKKIDKDEMIAALEDLGISENKDVTQDQFSEFLGRLGFDEDDAGKIADAAFEEDDSFSGADLLSTIGDYAGRDGKLDKSELQKHNSDLAKLGEDSSSGWD